MPRRRACEIDANSTGCPSTDDMARGGRFDAGDDSHQRTFSGAVFADDGQHFSAVEREGNIVERANAGELFADVAHFEQRRDGVGRHRRNDGNR